MGRSQRKWKIVSDDEEPETGDDDSPKSAVVAVLVFIAIEIIVAVAEVVLWIVFLS